MPSHFLVIDTLRRQAKNSPAAPNKGLLKTSLKAAPGNQSKQKSGLKISWHKPVR
jgi:hypothetical protein